MPQFQNFTSEDKIVETQKVTKGFFTGDLGSVTSFITGTLSASQDEYYLNLRQTGGTADEFSVSYGHYHGSMSSDTPVGQTKAVYWSMANLLLFPSELETQGFTFSSSAGAAVTENDVFFVTAERARMKDRLNKKNWTIILSGSNTAGTGGANPLSLTDDSANDNPTSTIAGDRYNIVSGSAGTIVSAATVKTYGFFYPDHGIMVFSGAELSASMPGSRASGSQVVVLDDKDHKGFAWATTTNANRKTALRFVNCLKQTGAKLQFRDEEDQISQQYFCRLPAGGMNFSNNPTFVSGSDNEIRNKTMWDNPTVYVSSVQLYNNNGDCVAVGSLSTPLKKNFSSEATIKVKLTY